MTAQGRSLPVVKVATAASQNDQNANAAKDVAWEIGRPRRV